MMTILAFLVTIGVLVVIHEYGHYRAAVACDVKVLRFSVGFGKVLWRTQRGETEFVVSALPFGGYVKMLDEREAPVSHELLARAFNRKPLAQRAFIVAAGPMANLLLAVLLYAAVNWAGVQELRPWMGQPRAESMASRAGLQAGDEILSVAQVAGGDSDGMLPVRSMSDLAWQFTQAALSGQDVRIQVASRTDASQTVQRTRELLLPLSQIPASEVDGRLLDRVGFAGPYAQAVIDDVVPEGPAAKAGLIHGDRVLSVNGTVPQDAAHLRQLIRASAKQGSAQVLALVVERQGQRLEVKLNPVMKDVQGQQVPRIEAALGNPPATVTVRYGLVEGFTRALRKTWDVSAMSVAMLGKMVIGEASLKNLSGPLTIADYAGRSAEMGWIHYIGFLALVSVSLGVLNLLPLPVLDGGHLMYYLFEGVTGRPVSELWLERLQRGGLAIMLVMMSLAIYNDLARILGAH